MKRLLLTSILVLVILALPLLAQWEPDERLTFGNLIDFTSFNDARCIATIPGGTLHVVWANWPVYWDSAEVYYMRSTDAGTTWETSVCLSNDPDDTDTPAIAVSGTNVHVVWRDQSVYRHCYTRSTDGGMTWAPGAFLTDCAVYGPAIAVSGLNVHVVWRDNRDDTMKLYHKRSTDNGTTWSSDTPLTYAPYGFTFPLYFTASVAASGPIVHIVWNDCRDDDTWNEIYYKRSTDNGATWGPDTRLTNYDGASEYPSIAVDGNNVHVAWEESTLGSFKIFHLRSTDAGVSWEPDQCVSDGDVYSGWSSIDASGSNVHVAWADERDGGWPEIYYARSTDNGATWESDTRLTNEPEYSGYPHVAACDTMVHVIWMDQRDELYGEIYYKRNPTGNAFGIEENRGQNIASRLTVVPNPFISFATVTGHESERFTLYDIAGRQVSTYQGNRIGEGLEAGVYFLVSADKPGVSLRIVKLR